MIRINLLGGERQVKKRGPVWLDAAQRVTLACVLVVVGTAAGVGYWYYSLSQRSTQVDADIVAAQQEQARLQSILREVAAFDQRRGVLQQRVALIEQLRSGQSVPVQLLDMVSKSVPDMLWLTDLEQKGSDVTIQGQSTTLIALSDFVGNLGASPLLKRPIEIIDSKVETVTSPGQSTGVDLIKFTVKAQMAPTQKAAPAAAAPAATAPGAAGAQP
jgi:type IV pilus assembly protein PilN